jgi:hypothetical protein
MKQLSRSLTVVAASLALACIGPAPLKEAPPIVPPAAHGMSDVPPSSVQKWAGAKQTRQVVEFFSGLFDRVGIQVTDTGEAFTVIHRGDRMVLSDELDPETVDFVVPLESPQVDLLVEAMEDGELGELARFRIMVAIGTPATRALLQRPVIQSETLKEFLYWIGDAEPVMQVVIAAPEGERDAAHTIERTDDGFVVTRGLHGTVSQIYRLTTDDAQVYQRRMMAVRKENSLAGWFSFARWYGSFTERVAVPVGTR